MDSAAASGWAWSAATGCGDAFGPSWSEGCWKGDVLGLARPEIWGWLLLYGAGSDESTCIPPYCRAAISCGDRGRDLRLSFCRRFWNHIWGASPVSYAHRGARKTPIERVGRAGSSIGAHGTLNSYLDLFLVEGHALHNVQTRCLVRLRVGVVCCLEDCLVLCTEARRELG